VAIGNNRAVARQLRTLFDVGTIRELTDGQLLERFATGPSEAAELAFAVLVERHGPMVLRVCRSVLADPHDSDDAFQATFLVLVKQARGLWVRDSIGPWLHQVAYRTASCARLAAARRHRHERRAALVSEEARTEVADDLGPVLHEEIDRLPERFRAPLVLCDLEGRTHEQAARHLGWPVGTLKSRQARGRKRLRQRLERRGVAPNAAIVAAAIRHDASSALCSHALIDATAGAAVRLVTSGTVVPGATATLVQGVLRSMSMTKTLNVASVLLIVAATGSGAGWLAQRRSSGDEPGAQGNLQANSPQDLVVFETKPAKLVVNVVERGTLEAAKTQDLYCLVEGRTTIIALVPEGTRVTRDQIVCELESAFLRDQLVNQRITSRSAEAIHENAKLAREIAEIAVAEYFDGTLKQEINALKAEIAGAKSAVDKAERRLERTRRASKLLKDGPAVEAKNARSADVLAELDINDRLEDTELTLERERKSAELTQAKLDVLEKYTRVRVGNKLKVDVESARSHELAKKATWELELSKGKKLERQIAYCTIKAPADGVVVYASDPNRAFTGQPQVEEGAQVREQQKILSVTQFGGPMRVNVKVPEPYVAQIGTKMVARIRVDAFPDQVLSGTVSEVAPLPDPATRFSQDGRKVYTTRVRIDSGLAGLRPGMTADVEIVVAELENALSVPVEAVVRSNGKDHVAVKKIGGGIDWREVRVGVSNGKWFEVKQGITSGEQVILNPRAIMTADEKRRILGAPTQPGAQSGSPR